MVLHFSVSPLWFRNKISYFLIVIVPDLILASPLTCFQLETPSMNVAGSAAFSQPVSSARAEPGEGTSTHCATPVVSLVPHLLKPPLLKPCSPDAPNLVLVHADRRFPGGRRAASLAQVKQRRRLVQGALDQFAQFSVPVVQRIVHELPPPGRCPRAACQQSGNGPGVHSLTPQGYSGSEYPCIVSSIVSRWR